MPKLIFARTPTDDEHSKLRQLAHSRTALAQDVQRAQIILASVAGQKVPQIATHLHLDQRTVRERLKRFNAEGLPALDDLPRAGRPPTYNPEQVSLVIHTAMTPPTKLDLPFKDWTLERLQDYLNEQQLLAIKRSRIGELLARDGLRWREDESWFSSSADPEFVQKRGPSNAFIPARRLKVP